jgi:hypothetical protein
MKASFFKTPKERNSNQRNILYSVSFMLLVDSIGFGVIFPILPQLFFNQHLGLSAGGTNSFPQDKPYELRAE